MFPCDNAVNGLSGIIFNRVSTIVGGVFKETDISFAVIKEAFPGSKMLAIDKDMVIAIKVVNK